MPNLRHAIAHNGSDDLLECIINDYCSFQVSESFLESLIHKDNQIIMQRDLVMKHDDERVVWIESLSETCVIYGCRNLSNQI
jgi:hypothetical protein